MRNLPQLLHHAPSRRPYHNHHYFYYYVFLFMSLFSFLQAFQPAALRGGGGRGPTQPDQIILQEPNMNLDDTSSASSCRLIVCQITDVYTLENFPHLKTLLQDLRNKNPDAKVISVLTGDFLSPYLLSSVDRGAGMMMALQETPIDYLTWGNHEADIEHKVVCRHVRNFPGKFINSNMLDHQAMDAQIEYDVLPITSPDRSHTRKVGLTAVLSNDPALYSHFKPPGAFGGATITDPWEALTKYQNILQSPPHNCDVVLPLQHLYVPDDHKTCRDFDFPVILSGHDHHKVDEVVHGTRLLKPGMNAVYATILELCWPHKDADSKPIVRSRFVRCADWEPDPLLLEKCERAYDALIPLKNTELAEIPSRFQPVTSNNSRGSVCTMGKYICTVLKSSLNVSRRQRQHAIDAVILMGGNIRGNMDYPDGSFFSLEALQAEIKADEVIGTVPIPGSVLAAGIEATHEGDPIPGWMQYDEGIVEEIIDGKPKVTHVGGKPLEPERIYRVATKISDLTNGQSPPLEKYFKEHPEKLPPKGNYVNMQAELLSHFSRNVWRKIWDAISDQISEDCGVFECPEERLAALDSTGDGTVTVADIQKALADLLGYSVDQRETSLAQFIHSFADMTGDGKITVKDFQLFCQEMDDADSSEVAWSQIYAQQSKDLAEKIEEINQSV